MKRKTYSLVSLFAITLIAAIIASITTQDRGPQQDQLRVRVGESWKCYNVDWAHYGIYREGKTFFLTMACSASNPDLDPRDCKLEFSIPFTQGPRAEIKSGTEFNVAEYDSELGNLSYFYFLGYGDLAKGVLKIREVEPNRIEATLKANSDSLQVWTDFSDTGMTRSFD